LFGRSHFVIENVVRFLIWENQNKQTRREAEKSKNHPKLKVNGILTQDCNFISTIIKNVLVDSVSELSQGFSNKTSTLTPMENNKSIFRISEVSASAVDSVISCFTNSRTKYLQCLQK
jgi:hypothetical protein